MTHTPGPWTSKDYDSALHVCRAWGNGVTPNNTDTFGSCHGAHIADINYCDGGVATKEQAEANARLIAAAPELLEALKAIIHANDRGVAIPSWPRLWSNARAAIAKAEGK